jgi:hypothetical protein
MGTNIQWHSLHNRDVRASSTPTPADESGIADPFPTGTSVDIWWTGDKCFYSATVLTTRTAWHNIKRVRTLCREIYCDYMLVDGHMQWHSLHNNKVRTALEKGEGASRPKSRQNPNRAKNQIALAATGAL